MPATTLIGPPSADVQDVAGANPAASMPAAKIASLAERRGLRAIAIEHPAVAVRAALRTDAELIVLTGSFSHLGAADRYIDG